MLSALSRSRAASRTREAGPEVGQMALSLGRGTGLAWGPLLALSPAGAGPATARMAPCPERRWAQYVGFGAQRHPSPPASPYPLPAGEGGYQAAGGARIRRWRGHGSLRARLKGCRRRARFRVRWSRF